MDQNRLTGLVIGGFIILLVPIWTRTVFGVETNVLTALATVREVKEALDEKRRILARIDSEKDPAAADKAQKHMTVAQEIHELAVTFSTLCAQRYPEYRSYFETSRGRIELDYATIQQRFQEITGSAAPGASRIAPPIAEAPRSWTPGAGATSAGAPSTAQAFAAVEAPAAPAGGSALYKPVLATEGSVPPPAEETGMAAPVGASAEQRLGSVAVGGARGGVGGVGAVPTSAPDVAGEPVAATPAAPESGPALHVPGLAKKSASGNLPTGTAAAAAAPADAVASTAPVAPEAPVATEAKAWAPPGRKAPAAPAAAPVTEVTAAAAPAPKSEKPKLHRPSLAVAEGGAAPASEVTEVTRTEAPAPAPAAATSKRAAVAPAAAKGDRWYDEPAAAAPAQKAARPGATRSFAEGAAIGGRSARDGAWSEGGAPGSDEAEAPVASAGRPARAGRAGTASQPVDAGIVEEDLASGYPERGGRAAAADEPELDPAVTERAGTGRGRGERSGPAGRNSVPVEEEVAEPELASVDGRRGARTGPAGGNAAAVDGDEAELDRGREGPARGSRSGVTGRPAEPDGDYASGAEAGAPARSSRQGRGGVGPAQAPEVEPVDGVPTARGDRPDRGGIGATGAGRPGSRYERTPPSAAEADAIAASDARAGLPPRRPSDATRPLEMDSDPADEDTDPAARVTAAEPRPAPGGRAETAESGPAGLAAVPIEAPVGAMMDLPWNRYSSWGLSIAELVFEEPIAEGRSQVLAVFPAQDTRLRKVGPLAPERPASLEFARLLGAVAVHTDAEGHAVVDGAVDRPRRTRDARLLEPGFFRMKQGPLAGRMFSSLPAINGSGIQVLDPVGVLSVSFNDRPHVGRNTDLVIPWGDREVPLFRYDGRAGRYHRVHGEDVVLDPLDGSPVVADNVVLLGRSTPQGVRCIVYTRGRIAPCLLQPRRDLLVTPENQPIALKPGTTWFLCPSGHVGIHAPPPAAAATGPRAPKLYGPGGAGRGS